MLKKAMLGVVITVVISLTAFGTVYAYQKEQADSVSGGSFQGFLDGPGYEDCPYYEEGRNEDCLQDQERIMEQKRLRNEDCECYQGNECQQQYRNENQNQQNECEGCGQRNRLNSSNGNRRYGR
jgi:hypothetical protein